MGRIVVSIILLVGFLGVPGCDLWILGSEKTGYKINIETDQLRYSDLKHIEDLLVARSYKVIFKEKQKNRTHPDEVYSLFTKTFIVKKNEEAVDVYLHFVKDESNNFSRHVLIGMRNWVRGGVVPQLKTEIDDIGDLIYQEIVNKIGKEHVTVKRFGKVAKK
jgi:hypothetical protein